MYTIATNVNTPRNKQKQGFTVGLIKWLRCSRILE